MQNFFVISGCSGGGKSTILSALDRQGHATICEPGRRVVKDQVQNGGTALPWIDLAAFAREAMACCLRDYSAAARLSGPVFFDRSLIDAVTAFEHATGSTEYRAHAHMYRYAQTVFLAPPWPEIYKPDAERRHGLEDAKAEFVRLEHAYQAFGYSTVLIPKAPVAARVNFILSRV
ncbi:AAA family ATPase [Pseudovibrio exalbescens]|uniref:AAA family ATPase n=1 Tax=Pseudovibrio exalbescens TaxID=197461 RepID=UPI002365BA02|nr:AAA family ATPase [Pseudovibrio exalbescens]MDD7909367.1 AAA family ATPase [Pseudovibrio exalbescens]